MKPHLRKFLLTAHVTFSVGWLGSVVAYLPLAITGLTSQDIQIVRACYLTMELIGSYALIPLSLTAMLTGLIQSLGTAWGLFRHYWIVTKFFLTTLATTILLIHMRTVSRMAGVAASTTLFSSELDKMRTQLVIHAVGGLLVLLVITVISMYKPWGLTSYGKRKQK